MGVFKDILGAAGEVIAEKFSKKPEVKPEPETDDTESAYDRYKRQYGNGASRMKPSSAYHDSIDRSRKAVVELAEKVNNQFGVYVHYKIGLNEGEITHGGVTMKFKGNNCFFSAEMYLEGLYEGLRAARNANNGVNVGAGGKVSKPEELWDPVNKEMAKLAVVHMRTITTESLHLVMRDCFIQGVKAEQNKK